MVWARFSDRHRTILFHTFDISWGNLNCRCCCCESRDNVLLNKLAVWSAAYLRFWKIFCQWPSLVLNRRVLSLKPSESPSEKRKAVVINFWNSENQQLSRDLIWVWSDSRLLFLPIFQPKQDWEELTPRLRYCSFVNSLKNFECVSVSFILRALKHK